LDIILGIRPQRDLPFAELNALYTHIFTSVEDIEHVLEILSIIFFFYPLLHHGPSLVQIEKFLSLRTGDVKLYLVDLSSLMSIGPVQEVHILHASLTDFLMDPTRSKELWINPPTQHTVFARRCLQSLQFTGQQDHSSPMILILNPE